MALIQGIRNNFSGDRTVGEYRLFYEGSGETNNDMHAGVIVAIKANMIEGCRITKVPACAHRALLIRIKSEFVDVTLITGYAPGDHLLRSQRALFWKQVGETISRLPKRTTVIFGIDANGHMGRDGTGMVEGAGAERWTENGQDLHTLAERCGLAVLNTRENCKGPGWTWKKADGAGQGRIDYLMISYSKLSNVSCNTGACDMHELDREGSPIDHRPVLATLTVRLLDELRPTGDDRGKPGIMTQFNRVLSSAFVAYQTDRTNQFTLHKKGVNQEHLDMARNMIDSFARDIRETWDNSATIDDKVSVLDIAATNVYNEYCRKQSPVVVKQKYMSPELVSEACEVHVKWRIVKILGVKSGVLGWEKEVRLFSEKEGETTFGKLNATESHKIAQQTREWNRSRKELRVKINKAKSEYVSQLIEETKGGNITTIWNTINIIAPRKFNNRHAMQKVNGGWCMEPEEDLAEIRAFAQEELKQIPAETFVSPPSPGPCNTDEFEQPTPMDVIAGFRRTNPNKAGTGWSVPNKLWVILENESSKRFCEVWQQMGSERGFPQSLASTKVCLD